MKEKDALDTSLYTVGNQIFNGVLSRLAATKLEGVDRKVIYKAAIEQIRELMDSLEDERSVLDLKKLERLLSDEEM